VTKISQQAVGDVDHGVGARPRGHPTRAIVHLRYPIGIHDDPRGSKATTEHE
jgi:hypothetical protein